MPATNHDRADLRKHLEAAHVTRAVLFRNDATCKRLRFHDLRGTGLTWMAIRGDDVLKIQQRAGHTSFEMTQKYIRTAEAVGEVIGAVFPALPASLLSPLNGLANRLKDPQAVDFVVEAPGIEFGQEVPRGFGECGRIATKWLKFSSIAGPSEWSAFHSVRSGSASFLEGYGRRREKDFVPLALSPDGRGALTRGAPRLQ